MIKSDIRQSVQLICPTCGESQFESDEPMQSGSDQMLTCNSCSLKITRSALIEENHASINAAKDQIRKQVIDEFRKELRKTFSKSKFIKIR